MQSELPVVKIPLHERVRGWLGLNPADDRVIVLADKAPEVSKGGIIIPEIARDKEENKANAGWVIETGGGFKDVPMVYNIGDRVQFGAYSGSKFKFRGIELMTMRMQDILGKVNVTLENEPLKEEDIL